MNSSLASFIQADLSFWQDLLALDENSSDKLQILFMQRLFIILFHVGLLIKETPNSVYHYAKSSSLPLACYLNHGNTIVLSMDKCTFDDLLTYLCTGKLIQDDFIHELYIGHSKYSASIAQQLLYKHPVSPSSSKLPWQAQANQQAYYIFSWSILGGELNLHLQVSSEAGNKKRLSLNLQGYPHAWPFYGSELAHLEHPLFIQHRHLEQQKGRNFFMPHPKVGIRGELTQTELSYICQMPFTLEILAKPPTEHQEADLNSHLIPPLEIFLQRLRSYQAQEVFQQYILKNYQAYKALEIEDYSARRNFLNNWIGDVNRDDRQSLLYLERELHAARFSPYNPEQQKVIHAELIDPLLALVARELMAIIKFL